MDNQYLIYTHGNKIIVKEGHVIFTDFGHRQFIPMDNRVYRYHTKIPDKPLYYQHGKIFVDCTDDIPKAIDIVKSVYKKKLEKDPETLDRWQQLTNSLIIERK